MPIQDSESMNLDLFESCLARFIRENMGDAALRGLPLGEDSVKGRRVMERKDLWFLGDWVIQGTPPRFQALWSTDVAPGESVRVIVHIERTANDCVVSDWDVEETF